VSANSFSPVLCRGTVFVHASNGSELVFPLHMSDQKNDENIPLGVRELLGDLRRRDRSVLGVAGGAALS